MLFVVCCLLRVARCLLFAVWGGLRAVCCCAARCFCVLRVVYNVYVCDIVCWLLCVEVCWLLVAGLLSADC